MPSGIRQTDSSVIKNSLSNLEAQVSAQSDEISALKALIVRLTSVVERLNEGGSEKCNKCNSDRAEFESALSASETEDASLPARKKRTRRRRKNVAPLTEENRSSLSPKKAPKPPTKQQELKSPSKNEVPNTVSEQNKNDDAPYIRVTHKRPNKHRNKQVVRCSGDPSDFLCAAERIRYLHVWGARLDTTEANVITYLNTKNTSSLYSVKKMLPKRQTDYATFKVGVPADMFDDCLTQQFWPKGLMAERWLFRLESTRRRTAGTLTCVLLPVGTFGAPSLDLNPAPRLDLTTFLRM
ncbi:hypothetical protein O0L34_g14217 [Tuta absoluta]|nr:hypothetical protein O0L34_g14217 [Tuta absoluta]